MSFVSNNQSLVSIIVITYNSSAYITETLESIKAQTYTNLELIVSDDCSKDNTVQICSTWIEKNKYMFVRTELITINKNTGIAPNCNRGLSVAEGNWVKFIAGDDMLFEDCIAKNMNFVSCNLKAEIIFSNISVNGSQTIDNKDANIFFSKNTATEQYKILLKQNLLSAPASFIKRSTINSLNGFDEEYPMLEDYPFFLKAIKNNIKIYKNNETLVYYRVHEENVSLTQKPNLTYIESLCNFYKKYYLDELKSENLYIYYLHYSLDYQLLKLLRKSIITNYTTYLIIIRWIGLIYWMKRIRNLIYKITLLFK